MKKEGYRGWKMVGWAGQGQGQINDTTTIDRRKEVIPKSRKGTWELQEHFGFIWLGHLAQNIVVVVTYHYAL